MEYFDLCDESGQPLGGTVSREEAHRTGALHRTAHVWILDRQDGQTRVLLQKRSMNKDSWPGQYDTSSAGHIPAGDEPRDSALRELREELGITAAADELRFIGNFRVAVRTEFHNAPFLDNEVVYVYVYDRPVDPAKLTLQPEEVEDVAWFELGALAREYAAGSERLCVPEGGLRLLLRHCGVPAPDAPAL